MAPVTASSLLGGYSRVQNRINTPAVVESAAIEKALPKVMPINHPLSSAKSSDKRLMQHASFIYKSTANTMPANFNTVSSIDEKSATTVHAPRYFINHKTNKVQILIGDIYIPD